MILTGKQIIEEVRKGRIVIDPFNEKCINPNSYNFTLSDTFLVYDTEVIETKFENKTKTIKMTNGELLLEPRKLYLAATCEKMGSQHFVPTFAARSSIARLGMFINLSAPLGDIGFVGCWTLQLFAIHPIRVYKGMQIGQMMFWKTFGDIVIYDRKYQGSDGPRKSQIYKDVKQPQFV
jgi:dCTP deaminase